MTAYSPGSWYAAASLASIVPRPLELVVESELISLFRDAIFYLSYTLLQLKLISSVRSPVHMELGRDRQSNRHIMS